jgi:hypothetical protein
MNFSPPWKESLALCSNSPDPESISWEKKDIVGVINQNNNIILVYTVRL